MVRKEYYCFPLKPRADATLTCSARPRYEDGQDICGKAAVILIRIHTYRAVKGGHRVNNVYLCLDHISPKYKSMFGLMHAGHAEWLGRTEVVHKEPSPADYTPVGYGNVVGGGKS